MKVDLQQLKTFRECPLKYKYMYVVKADPEFVEATVWSEYVVQTLFAQYIYHNLGNITHQLQTMNKRFNRIWNSSVLPIGPARLADELKQVSLAAVINFWVGFSSFFSPSKKVKPYILPNVPFNIQEVQWKTSKKHIIQGYIDAVYINILGPNVVKWVHYPPYSGNIDTEYEALLYAYAYKKITGYSPREILIFYLYDGTSVSFQGSRSHKALYLYDYLIDMFSIVTTSKKYYPNIGIHCRRCPFKTRCMKDHGIDFTGGIRYGRRTRYPRVTGNASAVQRLSPMSELRRAFEF